MRKDLHNYCGCRPATHAFCPSCKDIREVQTKACVYSPQAPQRSYSGAHRYAGVKLVCQACGHTVSHLYRLEQVKLRLSIAPKQLLDAALDKAIPSV